MTMGPVARAMPATPTWAVSPNYCNICICIAPNTMQT